MPTDNCPQWHQQTILAPTSCFAIVVINGQVMDTYSAIAGMLLGAQGVKRFKLFVSSMYTAGLAQHDKSPQISYCAWTAGGDDVDWSSLRQLAFCPCMKDPPTSGLPWSESQTALAPACLTILPKHLWISSYGARVLDCPCSDALALRMEWNRPPRPAQIATHLQALGGMHKQVGLPL